MVKYIFVFLIVLILTACNFQEGNRSGDLEDDYVEEPISERSQKYKNALEICNYWWGQVFNCRFILSLLVSSNG